jgi:hypothetical protein
MPRNITVTFNDGSTHVYQNAPDDLTPDMVTTRAQNDFGKSVTALDGGRGAASVPGEILAPRAAAPATPQQPLTTTQRIYQAVRPYAAPTLEALGTVGGGVAGTALGPAGTVAGAGLGYGIVKELEQLGDVYLGGKAPRQGAEQIVEPLKNVMEGATYEAGGRVAAPLIAKGIGKVMDLRNIPTQKAAELARNALGPDLTQAVNTLRQARPNQSAAQATADINSPTWQALVDRALQRDPRFLTNLSKLSDEDAVNALSKLAGGATATEVRATGEAAKNALTEVTGPVRETALSRANLGKDVAALEGQAGTLGQQATDKVAAVRRLVDAGNVADAAARSELIKRDLPVGLTKYTYKGDLAKMADEWASQAANASLDLGQGARFAQGAADSLRSVGIKPLESQSLINSVSAVANKPEFAGNDLLSGAVKNVADDIAKWTNGGGIIDAKALDAIRKNSVNAAIQQLRPGADATTQRNLAASVLDKIKPVLVDAIEEAGGKGYRQYLQDYSNGMQRIAERNLTGEALNMFKTNKDAFVRLVQGNSPETVEKILGPGNYDIAKEVADNTTTTLQAQAEKVIRDAQIKSQVSAGQDALKELLIQNTSKLRLPSYLSAVAATTNKALNILENKIGVKTMQTLTEAFKSPEATANLLDTLPASERNRVLRLLSKPELWKATPLGAAGGVTVGTVNSLAPQSENQNALAE